jgi:hypothetical protein
MQACLVCAASVSQRALCARGFVPPRAATLEPRCLTVCPSVGLSVRPSVRRSLLPQRADFSLGLQRHFARALDSLPAAQREAEAAKAAAAKAAAAARGAGSGAGSGAAGAEEASEWATGVRQEFEDWYTSDAGAPSTPDAHIDSAVRQLI